MTDKQTYKGSCLCGAIQFVAHGPSKWCAHCHCSLCRAAHGAGYVTWAGFEQTQVNINNDTDQLCWFESSVGAQRGFCRNCGSSLFFRSRKWPGELHIALGCIHDEIDRQPQANVFFDRHVNWMPIDKTLKNVSG